MKIKIFSAQSNGLPTCQSRIVLQRILQPSLGFVTCFFKDIFKIRINWFCLKQEREGGECPTVMETMFLKRQQQLLTQDGSNQTVQRTDVGKIYFCTVVNEHGTHHPIGYNDLIVFGC